MKKVLILTAVIFQSLFVHAQNIKDYICVVREQYSQEQTEMYDEYIKYLKKKEYKWIESNLKYAFKQKSFGSGFIYVDEDGTNYIFTNCHVLPVCSLATVEFEGEDKKTTRYENLRVIARDMELDLAVLKFEGENAPFKKGLEFNTAPLQENTEVYSAGFPAFGNEPLWQLGKGTVTNSRVSPKIPMYDPSNSTLIQHSAIIDPGNSGGPLLLQDSKTGAYTVLGINTWQAYRRQNTNFAIPSRLIMDFFRKAVKNPDEDLEGRIKAKAERFKNVLNERNASFQTIRQFISPSLLTRENIHRYITKLDDNDEEFYVLRNYMNSYTTDFVLWYEARKIYNDFNTIEDDDKKDEEKKSSASDETDEEEEKPEIPEDVSFYELTDVQVNGKTCTALMTDKHYGSTVETRWVYDLGTWTLKSAEYKEKGNKEDKKTEHITFRSVFRIGTGRILNSEAVTYDGADCDPELYMPFEFAWDFMFSDWFYHGIQYTYQVTENDTLKLLGVTLTLQVPLSIKNNSINPFIRGAGYYSVFSDDAAYGWSVDGGINLIHYTNSQKQDGFGIGGSLRYMKTTSLNKNCCDYKFQSASVYLIFPQD